MRIQINLNEKTLERVEEEAKRIGVSRGSMLSTWIGEKINSIDQTRGMFNDLMNNENMQKIFASMYAEQEKKKGGK